jgi:hypothetical protein
MWKSWSSQTSQRVVAARFVSSGVVSRPSLWVNAPIYRRHWPLSTAAVRFMSTHLRNVGIVAHIDAGKVFEHLLYLFTDSL